MGEQPCPSYQVREFFKELSAIIDAAGGRDYYLVGWLINAFRELR
jgi:hypothetical protein